jgi:uncharacterized protein (DUF2141 family)
MKGTPFKELKVKPVNKRTLMVNVHDLPPGEYGITVYHDLNADNALNKSWVGKPTEPMGFSNNAKPNFGPPGFEEIKFNFPDHRTIIIDLI